jgi:phosphoethanolamine N-methyltransferase
MIGDLMNISQTSHPSFPSVVINKSIDETFSKDPLSNLYSPLFLRALEYIYGSEGIISSGGIESVDEMFANIDLDNKTLLDVGCGFGGVDLYLAKKYKVIVTGVDREAFMIECANNLLKRSSVPLKGRVSYQTLADPLSLKEFSDNTFDVVLCKQVLYHLSSMKRELYLKEIFRVLKPGGMVVTEDLLTAKQPYTDLVNRAFNIEAVKENLQIQEAFCYLITPKEYGSLMNSAGFEKVDHVDNTNQQISYTKKDIERIQNSCEYFSKELGKDTYEFVVDVWDKFIKAMIPHELISGIFTATKK